VVNLLINQDINKENINVDQHATEEERDFLIPLSIQRNFWVRNFAEFVECFMLTWSTTNPDARARWVAW